ncbi:MAG: Maf family protein [Ferruginibacter sp.]
MFKQKIILASQSPRRKQLLEWAEIGCDIIVSETDESFPAGLSFENTAIHIARNKALAVVEKNDISIPVLAADTIVVCDELIIGKPTGRDDAIRILEKLSGKQHQVITGVVILSGKKEIAFADTTLVIFHSLTKEQIIFYVDNYKPYDKAGAYAIQEWIGVTGIKSINGDFYNVMGLPVSRVIQQLKLL